MIKVCLAMTIPTYNSEHALTRMAVTDISNYTHCLSVNYHLKEYLPLNKMKKKEKKNVFSVMWVGNSVCGMRPVTAYPYTIYGHSAVLILWCTLSHPKHSIASSESTYEIKKTWRTPWLSILQIYEDSNIHFLEIIPF